MEMHKEVDSSTNIDPKIGIDQYWDKACDFVLHNYCDEFNRVSNLKLENISDNIFFQEYIWVVHTTGFSAKAVSKFIGKITESYGGYQSLAKEDESEFLSRVTKICNNPSKLKSVKKTAELLKNGVEELGWETFRNNHLSTPEKLQKLPYIGKITCYHLGRNIGMLDCVKPDLHLVRMADEWGYESCDEMCAYLSEKSQLRPGVVDLILWYAASSFGTKNIKKNDQR